MPRHWPRSRRRRRLPAQHAGQSVLKTLEKLGLSDQAKRLRIAAVWKQAVGPEIAARTQPQSFNRGVFVVKTSSAAWQNELTFLKQELITRLNEVLEGKIRVRELKVICGTIRRPEAHLDDPPKWVTAPVSVEERAMQRDTSQPIADEELKSIFEHALLLHHRSNKRRQT